MLTKTKELSENGSAPAKEATLNEQAPIENIRMTHPGHDVALTFINESNDMNNSSVVIFQKNVANNFEEHTIAWKVIDNCGRGWTHPFVFSANLAIGAGDAYGNLSSLQDTYPGEKWQIIRTASGDSVQLASSPASNPDEIEIENDLTQGAISANIYRNGKLLVQKVGVGPMQRAAFKIKPVIYIGVVSQVEEGTAINSALLSELNTSFDLTGLTQADIIMTGGGVGATAMPFSFHLVPR